MSKLKSLQLCIIFIFMGLIITPTILFADNVSIGATQASYGTGTVFSDYTGWGHASDTYVDIRAGRTPLYNYMLSGGWARFDISSIPDSSKINGIRFYYTVSVYDGVGPYVDLVKMPKDPLLSSNSWQTVWNDLYYGSAYYNTWINNQNTTFYVDLPSLANQDLQNQLSSNWFAIGFRYTDTSGYYAYIEGWNSANRPSIVVDYTPSTATTTTTTIPGATTTTSTTIPGDTTTSTTTTTSSTTTTTICGQNPQVSNLSKKRGTAGDEVTIAGTNFCGEEKGSVIFARGGSEIEVPADDIADWTDTEILVSVPWGCKSGTNKVKVITSSGSESNRKSFTFVKPKPKITGLSSRSGEIDEEITIDGINFGEENDDSQVLFGSEEAEVSDWTDESITVTVPDMSIGRRGKTVSVRVKTMYGTSNSKKFKVLP